jgi:hypothetical protein
MYQGLTIEKIRNTPMLRDEKWFATNKPMIYKKILGLTKHMNSDSKFIDRIEYINKLIIDKKICVLYFLQNPL